MLEEGKKFPALKLTDQNGDTVTFADLSGENGLLLYAYPKDDTPGCTTEATDFRQRLDDFRALGINVVGLSPDSPQSHCDFRDKYGLPFVLLSDPDKKLLTKLGAFGEKKMYGKTTEGVIRSTFQFLPSGKLLRSWRNVRAKGHAERVLKALQS